MNYTVGYGMAAIALGEHSQLFPNLPADFEQGLQRELRQKTQVQYRHCGALLASYGLDRDAASIETPSKLLGP